MRRYHFQCGCWHDEADTIRERSRYLCPEHKKFAVEIEIECIDCMATFIVKPSGGNTIRCRECAREAARKRNGKYKQQSIQEGLKHKPRKRKKGRTCPVCGRRTSIHNPGACFCHDVDPDTDCGRAEFFDRPWAHDPNFRYWTVVEDPMGEDVYAAEEV
uniref:Uncharacterized protein n=1 Tax=viral metagenome TaxID=1070528 RepID=A0A6M3JQ82_9ZZZZ